MKDLIHNDQAHIADGLLLEDDFVNQTARINFCKINYYKFTLLRPLLKEIREELRENIRKSLFHFSSPADIIKEIDFSSGAAAN